MSYRRELNVAVEAALEAGEILRQEFHLAGGPRGHIDHAEADEVAEWAIRKRLLAQFPTYRYRGEETGSVSAADPFVWLVDPNDGTSAYLRGERGSAVSVGLVRDGVPLLGVVYAFAAPDDRGDLICWAKGEEFTRNNERVKASWEVSQEDEVLILVSTHRESLLLPLIELIRPYRFRAYPSIAYRLALAAAGEAAAALSWHSPGDWDYAGGHALLRARGGDFVDENGNRITYGSDGASKTKLCFGGHRRVIHSLWRRDWSKIQTRRKPEKSAVTFFSFARLKAGNSVADPALLSRAQGCLIGHFAADVSKDTGQPQYNLEPTLLLARSIAAEQTYDAEKIAQAYYSWFSQTHPVEVDPILVRALSDISTEDLHASRVAGRMTQKASPASLSDAALLRVTPPAIFGFRKPAEELWKMSCEECSLTHSNIICQQVFALLAGAIAGAIRTGESNKQIYERTCDLAQTSRVEPKVLNALQLAGSTGPQFRPEPAGVLFTLQHAFFELLHANHLEEALKKTIPASNQTTAIGAVTGALLGAVYGRESVPVFRRQMVLSSRPFPRPHFLWPVDLLTLAELVLLCG